MKSNKVMKLIDKDALVAEIDNRLEELWDSLPNASDVVKDNYTKEEANVTGKYTALESFMDYINTLEVKEVDLEKELDAWIKYGPHKSDQELTEFENELVKVVSFGISTAVVSPKEDIYQFAKKYAPKLLSIARKQIASEAMKEKEYWMITVLGSGLTLSTMFLDHEPTRDDLKIDKGYGNIIYMQELTKEQFIKLSGEKVEKV